MCYLFVCVWRLGFCLFLIVVVAVAVAVAVVAIVVVFRRHLKQLPEALSKGRQKFWIQTTFRDSSDCSVCCVVVVVVVG